MPFEKPDNVRRTFKGATNLTKRHIPSPKPGRNKRIQRTNFWPSSKLDYEFLEKCKEVVLRLKHPTNFYKKQETEYRISIMRWSRGSYVDIRMYQGGTPKPVGILLHLDVLAAMMPDLHAVVRRLELEDDREPQQKAKIEVIDRDETQTDI